MFQEQIASYLADHLRTHIHDYLDEVSGLFTDIILLEMPKSIDATSTLGGKIAEIKDITPAYAVNVGEKQAGSDPNNLFTHEYEAYIAGILQSDTKDKADKLVKRHAAACEKFIHEHLYMHQEDLGDFSIVGLAMTNSNFTGVEVTDETDSGEVWVGAFTLNLVVLTSEDDARQHP